MGRFAWELGRARRVLGGRYSTEISRPQKDRTSGNFIRFQEEDGHSSSQTISLP
jgi:hypothetical protein